MSHAKHAWISSYIEFFCPILLAYKVWMWITELQITIYNMQCTRSKRSENSRPATQTIILSLRKKLGKKKTHAYYNE